jgi:uncharacterized protein
LRSRAAIATLLIAAVVAAACVGRNKSPSQNVSGGGNTQQASAASTVAANPSPQIEYVTDSANVLDQPSKSQLESTLAAFKRREKIDFAVVTVGTTGNRSIRDYSLDLARKRKTNVPDGRDNGGLFLLVAIDDRQWHIQITTDLEEKLTDPILTALSQRMVNSFKQKRYGDGINKYVDAIITKLEERN